MNTIANTRAPLVINSTEQFTSIFEAVKAETNNYKSGRYENADYTEARDEAGNIYLAIAPYIHDGCSGDTDAEAIGYSSYEDRNENDTVFITKDHRNSIFGVEDMDETCENLRAEGYTLHPLSFGEHSNYSLQFTEEADANAYFAHKDPEYAPTRDAVEQFCNWLNGYAWDAEVWKYNRQENTLEMVDICSQYFDADYALDEAARFMRRIIINSAEICI